MRLFEFEDAFANTLITVLRNRKGRSDQEDAPLFLPWAAVSKLMEPYGYGEITYQQFVGLYDQNPDFQSIVQNFNEKGLEVNTHAEMPEPEPAPGQELPIPIPKGPSVDQMASHGATYKPQLSPK